MNKLQKLIDYLKLIKSLNVDFPELYVKVTLENEDVKGVCLRNFKEGKKKLIQLAKSTKDNEIKLISIH